MKETQLQNKNSTNSYHQQTVLFESHPKKAVEYRKQRKLSNAVIKDLLFFCVFVLHMTICVPSFVNGTENELWCGFCRSVLDHKSLCLFSHIYSNCILCGLTLNNGPGSMRLRRAFDSLSFVLSISIPIFVSILFCLILLGMADFFI